MYFSGAVVKSDTLVLAYSAELQIHQSLIISSKVVSPELFFVHLKYSIYPKLSF